MRAPWYNSRAVFQDNANCDSQPPKRRGPAAAQPEPRKKRSALAKQNNLSAEQESEIAEAFGLFAVEVEGYEDENKGVLRVDDVRRCLM